MSNDHTPTCHLCGRRAVIRYSTPDRRRYQAYCSAHYLSLDHVPSGAICSRIRRTG